jgi:hypothetical protein
MADKPLPWFRFYSEIAADRKILKIARVCNMSRLEVVGIWSLIMCAANDSPVRGTLQITLQERYTVDDLSDLLGMSKDQTEKLLSVFIQLEMIEVVNDVYQVKNWNKRQFTSDNSTDRVRKHRQEGILKRSGNVTETHSDTDNILQITDTDTDTESMNLFNLYSKYIGEIPGLYVADEIDLYERECPKDFFVPAFDELNKKSGIRNKWQYVKAILDDWRKNGKKDIVGKEEIKPKHRAIIDPVTGNQKLVEVSNA